MTPSRGRPGPSTGSLSLCDSGLACSTRRQGAWRRCDHSWLGLLVVGCGCPAWMSTAMMTSLVADAKNPALLGEDQQAAQ
eukprot:6996721-Prorocentrum_lima.AAC.1